MKHSASFAIVAVLLGTLQTWAADVPEPFPDFTFRRVAVPSGTPGKLINVQIDPSQTVVPAVKPEIPSNDDGNRAPSVFDWFWDTVSADLSGGGAEQLELAVNHLATHGARNGFSGPRLKDVKYIADKFGTDILLATVGTRVSPALVLAVIGVESSGRVDAESHAGAQGLMQLIPATAERFGVVDAKNAAQNIRGGTKYLDWLMGEFDENPILVLAAYNAGENAVRKNGGVPNYSETRAYVPKALAAWSVARGLCLTPPELASDGCVFAEKEARDANE